MILLLYSDLHIRPERIEDCETVLDAIPALVKKHKVDMVINAGDTFTVRGVLRTSCVEVLRRNYQRWSDLDIDQTIIVGNHDQEDKKGEVHPMHVFGRFPGWRVVDSLVVRKGIAFMPYYSTKEEAKQSIDMALKKGAEIAVVHWGIQDAMMNDWVKDIDGVPLDWLKGFKRVFSGHYHYRNAIKNVQYIGSPIQQNFAEMGQRKGVLIYNTDTDEIVFEEIEGTAIHHEIVIDDGTKPIAPKDFVKGRDFLRVKVQGEAEFCSSVRKEPLEEKFGRVKIEREVKEKHFSRLKITSKDIFSTEEIMQKYVDFVSTPLDKKRLMDIGRSFL